MIGTSRKAIAALVLGVLASFPLGSTAHAQPGPAVIGGGSGIVIDDAAQCTVTTVGHDRQGRLVGLTAGHCGEPGATISAEAAPGAGPIGRIAFRNTDLDYALIEFDPATIVPVSRIGNLTITGIGAPPDFPAVTCKEGRTTGTTCGIVWGDLAGSGTETWTQMCVIEGDSGAPVVAGTTLVGMVNAYLGVGCLGPELGTNMTAIVGDLDARGGAGAGFQPI
ncbi:serine protease [Nocardia brasiliensis]|uniref:Serine protease n=1 Tax=Nocardia brasiliensis TaxID=37326 RepID=A0A6G9XMP9_NOCBR|nr:S1 family peptidase [Nocardia brasiliensis]QIS02169.1 serine protease [Nocardia brasiliensis]